ncbi:hypothetical protein [Lentzea cavernae]|uniref:Uncharacterized protein n=1 Tax=Lentzea cavernae TaxID=2020703 RepID=A0ABQ3MJD2_9PSEU|nr:hypothetical protein [Lentzea cavernae]GHH49231.1 hypothetical protein GCM10017774_56270 [Lentzea cavernae]
MSEVKNFSVPLAAFRQAEERACGGYLVARKAMIRLAARAASISQLVREHPTRADYRAALHHVKALHHDAVERTRLAWQRWNQAQIRSDAFWAATNQAAAPVAVAV